MENSGVDKKSFCGKLFTNIIKIVEDFSLMPASPSSVNNKNNSSSKVNVNVTPQNNSPFPGSRYPHDDHYGYNPPDFMKQMISSVLTFKDDIPNLLRRIAYTLIAFILITNCVMLGFVYRSFNELGDEIRENRSKITSVYNKQREILKSIPLSPVNPSHPSHTE
jgi:hypothetical protein